MGSVKGWFFDDLIVGNAWFLWVKWGWMGDLFWIICIDFLKILIKFDWSLIFQGLRGVLKVFFMIFDDVKMGENGVKWAFCRSGYRTQNGGRGVDRSDMPFLASGDLLQNVNHAPVTGWKDTIIVQYYGMFYFSTLKR